jgi:putative oxidoreductase
MAYASAPARHDLALLVLRVGYAALLISLHGWTRAIRVWNYLVHGQPWGFVDVVAGIGFPMPTFFAVVSVVAETIAAAMLIPGLWTRWAAIMIVLNFVVAVASEGAKGDPIELPALYLLGATVIALAGAGRFSLDGSKRR